MKKRKWKEKIKINKVIKKQEEIKKKIHKWPITMIMIILLMKQIQAK